MRFFLDLLSHAGGKFKHWFSVFFCSVSPSISRISEACRTILRDHFCHKSGQLLKCWISCENCPFLFWHVAFFNTNPSSGLKRNHKINAILKRFYKIQVEFTIILIILMLLVIITIMILHPTFLSSFKKHVFSPVLDLTINGPLFVGMMALPLYIDYIRSSSPRNQLSSIIWWQSLRLRINDSFAGDAMLFPLLDISWRAGTRK